MYKMLRVVLLVFVLAGECLSQLGLTGKETSMKLRPYAVNVNTNCGGTLIDRQWILTAGHCVTDFNNVVLGDGMVYHVIKSYTHPGFKIGPYHDEHGNPSPEVWAIFDFGLLKLERKVSLSDNVQPIDISDDITVPVGETGVVAAYSETEDYVKEHWNNIFPIINEGEFKTISDKECTSKLAGFNDSSMFCAMGVSPKDVTMCKGNSGSGFVMNGKLFGVISWLERDNQGCFPNMINVFSKVGSAKNWIKRQMTDQPRDHNRIRRNRKNIVEQ